MKRSVANYLVENLSTFEIMHPQDDKGNDGAGILTNWGHFIGALINKGSVTK